jgi:antitoxin PrlF
MMAMARMRSKGRITLPLAVREALALNEGDNLVSRIEGEKAMIARVPTFLELAGLAVPESKRSVPWDSVIARTYERRATSIQ